MLKDLGIVTVVDLRGKTEAQRAEKRARVTGTTVAPSADLPQTKDTAKRSPSPEPTSDTRQRDQGATTSGYDTDSSMDERPRRAGGEPGVLEAPIGAPADDFATALGAQGPEEVQDSTRMFFDVLPSKQFALTMFQMPGWVGEGCNCVLWLVLLWQQAWLCCWATHLGADARLSAKCSFLE